MTDRLHINCYPIRLRETATTIYFTSEEVEAFKKVSKRRITGNISDQNQVLYWSLSKAPNTEALEITSASHPSLFRDYLKEEVFRHFERSGLPYRRAFLGGTEVWVEQTAKGRGVTKIYKTFRVRVLSPKDQYVTPGWTLLVTFEGEHTLHPRKAGDIEIPQGLISTYVDREHRITRVRELEGQAIPEDVSVCINRGVASFLRTPWNYRREPNKYATHYAEISSFYSTYLRGRQIGNSLHILESGLGPVLDSQVWKTSVESNLLEFADGHTHFSAYMGLKEYGPVTGPNSPSYKFFFIFHESDREYANQLFQYLKRGFKGYPGLKTFVDVDLSLDREKTITFKSADRPADEICEALSKLKFDEGTSYLALYLTRIKRDDPDEEKHADYFKVKEALLSRNISSQVIFRDNIEKPDFNYYLPNISIAMLAKLGGTPWRLSREQRDELVIGIGAYHDQQKEKKYLGTTFSFRNDGRFVGFDARNCSDVKALGAFFENAIKAFVRENSSVKRVVIHFYKRMNNDEAKELEGALARLDLQVPYLVVSIANEDSHEYLIFDTEFGGRMPRSGICVKLKNGEFLLCNNTRYQERTGARIDDSPFPLKITVSRTNLENMDDETVRELLDQVYQFSRMYWRSVKQRSMPVTIIYSQTIARMAAHLHDGAVPTTDIARRTLWFL